jgi:hypothetical protein
MACAPRPRTHETQEYSNRCLAVHRHGCGASSGADLFPGDPITVEALIRPALLPGTARYRPACWRVPSPAKQAIPPWVHEPGRYPHVGQ